MSIYLSFDYPGKDDSLNIDGRNHSHAVVMKLVEKLEGRGHHVYTDDFYNSPALYGFGACGTVHTNRRGLPPEMKATLTPGDVCIIAIDEHMVALKWGR